MLCEESLGQAFAALGKLWQGFEDERSVCRVSALSEQGACDGGGWKASPGPLLGCWQPESPNPPPLPRAGRAESLPPLGQPALPVGDSPAGGEVGWDGMGGWGGERGCWQACEHVATEVLAGHLLDSGSSGGPAQPRTGLL